MKRISLMIMTLMMGFTLFAQTKVRLGGIMDWDEEREVSHMGGLHLEVIGENFGFGFEAMGDTNLDNDTTGDNTPGEAMWEGEAFLSYHVFGNDSFIDPYVQAGVGNAGYVSWIDEETADYLALSLYPSFSAGINAVFEGGLVLGMRHSYRPENNIVPGAGIPASEMSAHQTTIQIGYQFGGREKRVRKEREERYGCWKWCWCDDCDCDD